MHTRTIFCGIVAGLVCTAALHFTFMQAWPAKYISEWSSSPDWIVPLGFIFCSLIILMSGTLATAWGWKDTWRGSIQIGLAVGILASTVTYLLAGTVIASLLGIEPLLQFGLHQTSEEQLNRLMVNVVTGIPWRMQEILWAFMAAGALAGVAGSLLARSAQLRIGPAPKSLPGRLFTFPSMFLLMQAPIVIVATIAVLSILPDLVWKTITQYKITSFSFPQAILDLPVAIQLGIDAFGIGTILPWLRRWWVLRPRSCFSVISGLAAAGGIITIGYFLTSTVTSAHQFGQLIAFDGNEWLLPLIYYAVVFFLPVIGGGILGWFAVEKPSLAKEGIVPAAYFLDYFASAIVSGLLATFLLWVVTSYALTLTLGVVNAIPALTGEASGAHSLNELVSNLITFETNVALSVWVMFSLIGLLLEGLISLASRPEPV